MDHTIRLYSNPFKQPLYLLISLGFVAAGLLLLRDPKYSASAANVVIGYIDIAFFGLGVVIFLYSIARELLLRRPVLQVDAQGWAYNPALGLHPQHVPWQDIGHIALYRQRLKRNRMLYLVLEARYPNESPRSRLHAMAASLYPSMSLAVMAVPLHTVFMRASPAKVERLLHSIRAEFSGELHSYGITVDNTIQDM